MRCPAVIAAILSAGVSACNDDPSRTGWTTVVDSSGGVVRVVNTPPSSGEAQLWTLQEDLRIGSVEGAGPATFGQLKALVVDSAGRIIVLESQAQDIRVFAADGRHLATYGGKGGGPGEFQNALGIMQSSSGLLYVPDQRNARMVVLSVDSGFVTSYPLRLYRYGFVWNGIMRDDDHIVVPSMVPVTRRNLMRIYSLQLTQVDSVLMPEQPPVDQSDPPGSFAWQTADGRVRGFRQVPFYATGAGFLDRTGEAWSSTPGDPTYRVVRTTLRGDTTLVFETRRTPLPVTPAERDSVMDAVYEGLSEFGVRGLDASKVPTTKPTVLGLFTDNARRLWVHTSSADSLRRYDVYESDGTYAGTVATHYKVVSFVPPVVRGESFYAVVTDEVDVLYVVRARIVRP